jgi:hypothetical protein
VSTARLKKKEVETKTSKRKKNWLDKLHKSTKNGSNKGGKRKKKGSKVCEHVQYSKYICFSFTVQWEHAQFYFFYLKEQKTAKTGGKKKGKEASVHDNPTGQNIYPSTSLPMEEMSEPYMAINTFSQLLTVIFRSYDPLVLTSTEFKFSLIFQGATVDDLDVEF